jgi:hypothetical protein
MERIIDWLTLNLTGDFNGDGDCDGSDLAGFADAYANGSLEADLNGNGVVDETDVEVFAQGFGSYIGQ